MAFNRITNRLMTYNSVENLHLNLKSLNNLQNKLSSGKNINSPEDDPVGLSRLLSLDDTMNQNTIFVNNIGTARSELSTTDSTITQLTTIVQRANELVIQAGGATDASGLSTIKGEMQSLFDQIVQIGNTKFGDKYLFGGLRTTDAPFVRTTGTNEVAYQGTSSPNEKRQVEIGNGVKITINFAGDNVFGQNTAGPPAVQTGIIGTIAKTIDDLTTAIASPTDANRTAVSNHVGDIKNDLDTILSTQTTVGALINRLDLSENRLTETQTALSKEYGSIQDVDLAKVISDLNFQQTVFQTSLAATSKIMQPSLLNYL